MALYHRHRPQRFSQVRGNADVVAQLEAMIRMDDPPHAILLTGPSGCGKTTLGRIIVRALGVADEDFVEVDSADYRGIDSVREIRHSAQYRPLRGPRRAWLLDECHKWSNDAMTAMLKCLEDPPPHAYFVLCTTDPDKLLPTIRGRCSTYQVKLLDDSDMMELLERVARREGAHLDEALLDAIAERAAGHSRDALQILEKVLLAPEEGRRRVVEDHESLKTRSSDLARALLAGKGWPAIREAIKAIGKVDERTKRVTFDESDLESARRGVLGYCARALLSGENDLAGAILEEFREPFFSSGLGGMVLASYAVYRQK